MENIRAMSIELL